MIRKIFISFIIISQLSVINSFGKNLGKDSLLYIKNYSADFNTNLDSLLNQWYVKNSIKTDYSLIDSNANQTIPEFSDSVYI